MYRAARHGTPPRSKAAQLAQAEEQANLLRTVCFHIRREWYRKSTKAWMTGFDRPSCTLSSGPTGVPAQEEAPAPLAVPVLVAVPEPLVPVPEPLPSFSATALLHQCHSDRPSIMSLWSDSETEEIGAEIKLKVEDNPVIDLETDNELEFDMEKDDELIFIHGFDEQSTGSDSVIERKAWRKVVDSGGEMVMHEYASHTTPPEDGVGLMVGHFIDGTSHPISGMLFQPRKSAPPQPLLKRPSVRHIQYINVWNIC